MTDHASTTSHHQQPRPARFLDASGFGQEIHTPFAAAADRYQHYPYRRVGTSGLHLPPISLGLWWNFGDTTAFQTQRDIIRYAFDRGITHFDLANNYGPPAGAAEENFGRILAKDLGAYRDELIISSKAGWDMWTGPYGKLGSTKYLTASLDASLARLGVDYVDIFYSHRIDPDTPLEETIGALDSLVRAGKALYVGISSYSADKTRHAHAIAAELGTPLIIHQPAYSILNRWVEDELLAVLDELGMGSIAFTPLAQGLLTDKYLTNPDATPAGNRSSIATSHLSEQNLAALRTLNDIAHDRGQTLAQMAIAWLLRDPDTGGTGSGSRTHRSGGVTSVLLGASSTTQLEENLGAVASEASTVFTAEELAAINAATPTDAGINNWAVSSDVQ